MIKLQSLTENEQFLRILKKEKLNTNYFTIYFTKNSKKLKKNNNLNLSFVMKKKIGNAVMRNKIKRKFKSAIQKILIQKKTINLNYSYVVFGKPNAYNDKYSLIFNEFDNAFKKIKKLNN